MDILTYNRNAWDKQVENGNVWTVPVTSEQVDAARRGEWRIFLTPTKAVPRSWFPQELKGADVLCLASGGGQQGPILAAAGANVTVFDNSPNQLARDRMVAEREGLAIHTVQGDMADLSVFADESFDLVFNPVSTCFVPDVKPVWRECYRVLRRGGIPASGADTAAGRGGIPASGADTAAGRGGALVTGFSQPIKYSLDQREDVYYVRFPLPYSDLVHISSEERIQRFGADTPLEFGHTFADLLGGQLSAGFHLVDMYEDIDPNDLLDTFMPTFMATRAVKP